jgi:Ca2+-binding EF-hand superfamily protein
VEKSHLLRHEQAQEDDAAGHRAEPIQRRTDGAKEMFKAMDTDASGAITFNELKEGLRGYGLNLKESEVKDLMDFVRSSFVLSFLHPIDLINQNAHPDELGRHWQERHNRLR